MPEGLSPPTVVLITQGYSFSWQLPSRPNGIITRYTLYIGNSAIYNSTHADSVNITGAVVTTSQTYYLEAYNSAGSVTSDILTLDPIPDIGATETTVAGFTIGEAVGVIVVVATVIIVLFLILMSVVTVSRLRKKNEKPPTFLSHDFKSELTGVVSFPSLVSEMLAWLFPSWDHYIAYFREWLYGRLLADSGDHSHHH